MSKLPIKNRHFLNLKSNVSVKAKSSRKSNVSVKAKSSRKTKSKNKYRLDIIPKRNGRCVASILDENESRDPCNIHITENECMNETQDSEFWRSYKCNWQN